MKAPRFISRMVGPRLLTSWIPTSLFGRSFLIIVLPIAVMQLAVTWVFFRASDENLNRRLSETLAGDIAALVETYDADPAAFGPVADRAKRQLQINVEFKDDNLPAEVEPNFFKSIDRTLDRALSARLTAPYEFDTARYRRQVAIRVAVPGGHLSFNAPKDRAIMLGGRRFVAYILGATFLLTAVAVLFIRNQVRAIERLAEAAEDFGRGGDAAGFRPHGAREVRQAAQAFLDMRDNIQRFMEQRTALLASVSHDLRTPLTRLKLELALAEESKRGEAMKRDVAEMEHMIDVYLDFARGAAGEPLRPTDISALVHDVAEKARRGGVGITAASEPGLSAQVRPGALTRALANLVDNAAAFGDRVEIGAAANDKRITITVDDNGPGIAPERREEAFKPFSRLDAARNQNEKGVGLGLAIARDVARSHGGEIRLEDSPLGGLRAVVDLPA